MIDKWFISDTHWGHENILKFCPSRAVLGKTIDAHDEALIERWNRVVKPKDIVYHCGDVAFKARKSDLSWMRRLNGRIQLLRGNHDSQDAREFLHYVDSLLPGVFPLPGFKEIVLSHAPIHPMCLGSRWLLNVHGHIHESVVRHGVGLGQNRHYMNVSVEQIDFTPLHLDVVVERVRQNAARPGGGPAANQNLPGGADRRKR